MKIKTIIFSLFLISISVLSGCSSQVADEIPKPCTADWNPVCGIDGNTYGNKCNAEDIEIAHEGECKKTHVCTEEEKENQICTREYMPVCGNNNVTHATGCTACSAGVDSWTEGECSN